jgi:hypothetical protein
MATVPVTVGLIPGGRLVDDSQVYPHNHSCAGQQREDFVQELDDLVQKWLENARIALTLDPLQASVGHIG